MDIVMLVFDRITALDAIGRRADSRRGGDNDRSAASFNTRSTQPGSGSNTSPFAGRWLRSSCQQSAVISATPPPRPVNDHG